MFGQQIDQIVMMEAPDYGDVDDDSNTTEILRFAYHTQLVGSVTQVTGPGESVVESYRYDPYGTPTIRDGSGGMISTSAIENSYLFTARQLDEETGLFHYRARMYAPNLRRCIQRDPLEYGDAMNALAYAKNRPSSLRDPLGLQSEEEYYAEQARLWKELQRLWEEGKLGRGGKPTGACRKLLLIPLPWPEPPDDPYDTTAEPYQDPDGPCGDDGNGSEDAAQTHREPTVEITHRSALGIPGLDHQGLRVTDENGKVTQMSAGPDLTGKNVFGALSMYVYNDAGSKFDSTEPVHGVDAQNVLSWMKTGDTGGLYFPIGANCQSWVDSVLSYSNPGRVAQLDGKPAVISGPSGNPPYTRVPAGPVTK